MNLLKILDTEVDHFLLQISIWRHHIFYGTHRTPLFQNASVIRKSFKSKLTMSLAYATIIDPSKRQVVVEKMNGTVIYTGTSGAGVIDNMVDILFLFTVNIKG